MTTASLPCSLRATTSPSYSRESSSQRSASSRNPSSMLGLAPLASLPSACRIVRRSAAIAAYSRNLMRITGVEVQVVEPGMSTVVAERLILNLSNVIVRIQTDEGVEGVGGSTTYLGAHAAASAAAELRPLLVGEDPLYRERLWTRLNEVSTIVLPPHSLAVIDCALWG